MANGFLSIRLNRNIVEFLSAKICVNLPDIYALILDEGSVFKIKTEFP